MDSNQPYSGPSQHQRLQLEAELLQIARQQQQLEALNQSKKARLAQLPAAQSNLTAAGFVASPSNPTAPFAPSTTAAIHDSHPAFVPHNGPASAPVLGVQPDWVRENSVLVAAMGHCSSSGAVANRSIRNGSSSSRRRRYTTP